MRSSEGKELLRDVIAQGDYAQFRAELFCATSREFRRQHRKGSARAWLALAAILILSAVLGLQFFASKKTKSSISVAPVSRSTAPAAAVAEIVSTKPLPDFDVIRTVPTQSVVVRTKISFPEISDTQLLALLKDHGAGFVEGRNGRSLVVVNQRTAEKRKPTHVQ